MKQKKDTQFWLNSFVEEQAQTTHEYKSFQMEIENNGCFSIVSDNDKVKVYTPLLAFIFISKELPARNMDTQKETTLNGWEYLKTYIEAYKEGEQYFENELKVSEDTMHGANAEQYVQDIHHNYFHTIHEVTHEGWQFVKDEYSMILTHKVVKTHGYYSGIVSKVEEQVKKHPKLFAKFDKCEHDLPPQQKKTKTDKLKAPVLGLFCGTINKIEIDKREETESADIYCKRICAKYKLPYTDRVRQNYNVNETKKLIQELTEKVLPLIDTETKKLIQEYLERKQLPKQNLYA